MRQTIDSNPTVQSVLKIASRAKNSTDGYSSSIRLGGDKIVVKRTTEHQEIIIGDEEMEGAYISEESGLPLGACRTWLCLENGQEYMILSYVGDA